MITRQDGCHTPHQQDGGIAIVALMAHRARHFLRGHRRSRRPVAHSERLSAGCRSLGQARTRLAFGVVAFTGAVAFPSRSSLLCLGFGLPCLGALFEILQIFVPGREAAVGDALANTIGVAIGLAPFVIIQLGRIVRGFPARPERISIATAATPITMSVGGLGVLWASARCLLGWDRTARMGSATTLMRAARVPATSADPRRKFAIVAICAAGRRPTAL